MRGANKPVQTEQRKWVSTRGSAVAYIRAVCVFVSDYGSVQWCDAVSGGQNLKLAPAKCKQNFTLGTVFLPKIFIDKVPWLGFCIQLYSVFPSDIYIIERKFIRQVKFIFVKPWSAYQNRIRYRLKECSSIWLYSVASMHNWPPSLLLLSLHNRKCTYWTIAKVPTGLKEEEETHFWTQ